MSTVCETANKFTPCLQKLEAIKAIALKQPVLSTVAFSDEDTKALVDEFYTLVKELIESWPEFAKAEKVVLMCSYWEMYEESGYTDLYDPKGDGKIVVECIDSLLALS